MKKAIVMILAVLMLTFAACTKDEPAAGPSQSGETEPANPWHAITEAEAKEICVESFNVPEGAENVQWSVMDAEADASGVPGPLVQLAFDLDGLSFTAREQVTGDEAADISGLHYEWTAEIEETLKAGREELPCKSYRSIGDDGYVDLCTWFTGDPGTSYSLSVIADDLDGFDLLAIAEALYR
ncbi:MAG: hypothetical protein K6B40_03710 [Firmicutes bacterium]|nr:hypothetical protein [Bacillota bacterium]